MKIRIVRLGGIIHLSIIGPQEFVNFAVNTLRETNADKLVDSRMEKLGYCDVRNINIYRNMMRVEPKCTVMELT